MNGTVYEAITFTQLYFVEMVCTIIENIITSSRGNLPGYHQQIAPIVPGIVVALVNRMLSDWSINWPCVMRNNYPQKLVTLEIVSKQDWFLERQPTSKQICGCFEAKH